ncbi:hypothetical protein ATANTOWER_003837 [Ataeniobius toweri]|uniref:Uncharacterized protein n=1 Tax=Ataeniobius toweri TaxID=208326 RepID=A0ABU7BP29_9TELE|nr:hypothetical protein [Ataeniobius toweri]
MWTVASWEVRCYPQFLSYAGICYTCGLKKTTRSQTERAEEIPRATGNLESERSQGGGETGRRQSQVCAVSSDSIAAKVKEPVCLHQLSEAQPAKMHTQ